MSTELRNYYNNKYEKGGEYYRLYGRYNEEGGRCPSPHYGRSALYIDTILQGKVDSVILEIGCGTGALLWELKKIGYQNIQGIDISDRVKELSIIPGAILQGEAVKLNFEDKSFNLIVSIGTYEHIPREELELSFKEIIRVGEKAILWIDRNKDDADHTFNKDEEWWVNKIADSVDMKSIIVDKKMVGGSGIHPILINF